MATTQTASNRGRPVNPEARAMRMRQILDGARGCFAARGFHAASIAEVSSAAQVSTANIYQYFENKEALILALVEDDLARELDLISRISRSDMRPQSLEAVFRDGFVGAEAVESAVLRCEVLSEAARNPAVAARLRRNEAKAMQAVANGLRKAIAEGLIDPVPDIDQACEMIALVFDGLQRRLTFMPGQGEALLAEFVSFLTGLLHIHHPHKD